MASLEVPVASSSSSSSSSSLVQEQKERMSLKFNDSDADVILISKDRVRFHLHSKNLCSSSPVFNTMFEVSSTPSSSHTPNGLPTIELDDLAKDLETLFEYAYPSPVTPLELRFPHSWSLIRIVDKYEVYRAIEAVESALLRSLLSTSTWTTTELVRGYAIGSHLHLRALQKIYFQKLKDSSPSISNLRTTITRMQSEFNAGPVGQQLIFFFMDYYIKIDEIRSGKEDELTELDYHDGEDCESKFHHVLTGWISSASGRSAVAIRKLRDDWEHRGECGECTEVLEEYLTDLAKEVEKLETDFELPGAIIF